jgi:rhamnose utilization protein RhaD (predicted bifunctional aldolase and dehydrogenase)
MRNRPWPSDLDTYSALIGKNTLMVQGPGGNTSFKSGDTMWVKASGTRLCDAEDLDIFVSVGASSGIILDPAVHLRPSIEKDFHLLVPFPYVIHTHSLRALSMAIVKNFGVESKNFPDIAFVNYARPGGEVCALIREVVDFKIHKMAILQNHGLVTWGKTMEEAYLKLIEFENMMPTPAFAAEILASDSLKLNHPKAITPDYAVFLSSYSEFEIMNFTGPNLWKKQMFLLAQEAAFQAQITSEVNYLEFNEVYALQNWDSEKYRIKAQP